jgi:hypothetical protein
MKTPNGIEAQLSLQKIRELFAQKTTSPGILVFSRMMELLHANGRALELTDQSEKGATAPIRFVLLRSVLEVCAEIQQALDSYVAAGVWVPLEVSKLVSRPARWLLLRGFGLLDRNAIDHSRIVIVLDEVGFGEKNRTQSSQRHVQLGLRQRPVAAPAATR